MTQQSSPFIDAKYGWTYGESGWNVGMDENLLKFSFLFDGNISGIVNSLPAAVNGNSYFLTTDSRLYFVVGSTYYSSPTPENFIIKERSTGKFHQYTQVQGLTEIDNPQSISVRFENLEATQSALGTAAFEDVGAFASQDAVDQALLEANEYTDDKILESAPVSVLDYGAVGDGVTDNFTAFSSARTFASSQKRPLYIPAGNYKINSALSSNEDLVMYGDGDSTVLDFSDVPSSSSSAVEVFGQATQIESLSGTQIKGTNTVVFSSIPSLLKEDVFIIFNPTPSSWSAFRTYYFAGEWCEVKSVSGNTALVKSSLYDNYAAGSVNVYKISSPTVILKNFKVVGTGVNDLIKISLCKYPIVENITGLHRNDSVLYLDRCYSPIVSNPNISNTGDGGDDYGIIVGNCQHSRINGGSVYSRRHAITHGGGTAVCSVTNRDSRIRGVIIKNDINSGTEAADFHGNTEDSSYENCTIYGGANLQGKDNHYNSCKITNTLNGWCLYSSEVIGGFLGAINCQFITNVDPNTAGRGIFDIGGNSAAINANTTSPCHFFLKGGSVYGRNLSSGTFLVKMVNSGSNQVLNVKIDGITMDVNSLSNVLRTSVEAGTANSSYIIIDNISGMANGVGFHSAGGGSYLNFPHKLMRQTGSLSLTATSGTNSTISAPITFKHPYPRVPAGFTSVSGGLVGNKTPVAQLFSLSETTIRPEIFTGDGVNWNTTAARNVSWMVVIDEV